MRGSVATLCVYLGWALTLGLAHAACPTVPGDANGDGVVDVGDVQCQLQVAVADLGGAPPPACIALFASEGLACGADADCSGEVTVTDATLAVLSALQLPLPPAVDANQDGCADACDSPDSPCAQCDWLTDSGSPCLAPGSPGPSGCVVPYAPDGVTCSDGDPCTHSDRCQSGCCAGDYDHAHPDCLPTGPTPWCEVSGSAGDFFVCRLNVATLSTPLPTNGIQATFEWDANELALQSVVPTGAWSLASTFPAVPSAADGLLYALSAIPGAPTGASMAIAAPNLLAPEPYPTCGPALCHPSDLDGDPSVLVLSFELLADLTPAAPTPVYASVAGSTAAAEPLVGHVARGCVVLSLAPP